MSWLIDLAGKAEHYLDKIDQNTAVVLQNQKEKPLKDVFKYLVLKHFCTDCLVVSIFSSFHSDCFSRTPVLENVTVEVESKPIASVPSSPGTKSLLKRPKNDSRISDEHLLQYLNSHDSTIQSQVCYNNVLNVLFPFSFSFF